MAIDKAQLPHTNTASTSNTAIARDSTRTILSVSSKLILAASALIAEALAVREGVSLASGSYSCRTLIESDNLAVIEAIREGNQQCSIVQMVKDIQMSSSLIPNCGFLWSTEKGTNLRIPPLKQRYSVGTESTPSRPSQAYAETPHP
ncbi:Reverse transcriptase-like [Sesbania bispinosa]|nr:Reverse transcriptase-like [Sesbania bispinosa]